MKDESIHTITLVRTLLKDLGPECIDWEPVVIQKTMYDRYQAAKLNVYKALGGLAVLQQDRFWHDWQTFHFLAQVFNNNTPSASIIQELSVAQLMVAVDTAIKLREELQSLSYIPVFSEEVSKFVASQALNQGVWYLPEPLAFASGYACKKVLVCKDCKNESFVEEEEDSCPICTNKYDTTSLLEFSSDTRILNAGFGTNVHIQQKYPTTKVQEVFTKLLTGKNIALKETNQDHVCAAKVFMAVKYMHKRREELSNG